MPELNVPTTRNALILGMKPAALRCPMGDMRLTRLPTLRPKREARFLPTTMPGVPSPARSSTFPSGMSRSSCNASPAWSGSTPRSTRPVAPRGVESSTSV